jgi:hypothetical protein
MRYYFAVFPSAFTRTLPPPESSLKEAPVIDSFLFFLSISESINPKTATNFLAHVGGKIYEKKYAKLNSFIHILLS